MTLTQVTYSLSPSSQSTYGHVFGVNPESGEIFLKTALDYETKTHYDLVVTATDGGSVVGSGSATGGGTNPNIVEAKISVNVTDVNDYVPKVSVNTLTIDNVAVISEKDPPGE